MRWIGWFFRGLIFFVVGVFLFGYITMLLWNELIPSLFHGPLITYWQSVGLLVLCRLLFRPFGGPHGGHKHRKEWKQRHGGRHGWQHHGPRHHGPRHHGWQKGPRGWQPTDQEDEEEQEMPGNQWGDTTWKSEQQIFDQWRKLYDEYWKPLEERWVSMSREEQREAREGWRTKQREWKRWMREQRMFERRRNRWGAPPPNTPPVTPPPPPAPSSPGENAL